MSNSKHALDNLDCATPLGTRAYPPAHFLFSDSDRAAPSFKSLAVFDSLRNDLLSTCFTSHLEELASLYFTLLYCPSRS